MSDPGVEVGKLLRLVRDDVLAATANKQEGLSGQFAAGHGLFLPTAVARLAARRSVT
jgi:hypothetical protein